MMLRRVVALAVAVAVGGACAACGGSEEPADAPPPPPPPQRTVSLAWTVTDPAGAALTCDAVDGRFVTVTFFQHSIGQGFSEVFDCFRLAGTRVLEESDYTIGFELSDRFGTLATLPTRRYTVASDLAIDPAKFTIDPVGDLTFTLDTGLTTNCGGASPITAMTIELYRADGTTCEPAALTIDPATPYQVNCAAPPSAACLEKDTHVSGARLPAGEYRIVATALEGATPCWQYDQRQRIRAAGLSRSVTLPMTKICN